jgi:hypothetical protein
MRRTSCVGLVLLALAAGSRAQEKASQQSKQQQPYGAGRPFKIKIEPIKQGVEVGATVPVKVTLLDVYNEPVAADRDIELKANVTGPKGKSDGETEKLKAGQSSVVLNLSPEEIGLSKLYVSDRNYQLRGDSGYLLVTPSKPRTSRPATTVKPAAPAKPKPTGFYLPGARAVLAKWSPDEPALLDDPDEPPPDPPPAPARRAKLALLVSGGDGAGDGTVLADGMDAAKITVFYIAEDGGVPSSDIVVWLGHTNGVMEPSNRLTIAAGSPAAEATLTSKHALKATVTLVASSPALPIDTPNERQVKFVPPIFEIDLNGTQRMSIVQIGNLHAQFRGVDRRIIAPSAARLISFSSTGPVSPNPREREIKPGEPGTFIDLLPITIGTATVQASTHGYEPKQFTVEVTVFTVLLFCILGGLLGSVVGLSRSTAKKISPKVYLGRILAGELAAIVATWAYVFGALPNFESVILHNDISVLPVSLLAGYVGTAVLDAVAGKIFGTPQPS